MSWQPFTVTVPVTGSLSGRSTRQSRSAGIGVG
jgi:hypothetical protein